MAKEAGNTTPDYSLDSSTLAAVAKAGVSGGDVKQGKRAARKGKAPVSARQALDKADVAGAVSKGLQDVGADITKAKEAKKLKEKKIQDKIDEADVEWEDVFTKMKDNGGWANEGLYKDFMDDEEGFKKEYIALLEKKPPDNKGAQAKLKLQSERSSQLAAWKTTMGVAFKQSLQHDMSKVVTGSGPLAVKNRGILASLANAGNKEYGGKTNAAGGASMVMEDGVMKFEVTYPDADGKLVTELVTSQDIDEMMTTAESPIKRREQYINTGVAMVTLATSGGEFNMDNVTVTSTENLQKELRINPASAHSILHDPMIGESSLADYLTEAIEATPVEGDVQDGINFTINMPDADDLPKHPDGDDGSWDVDGVPGLSLAEIQAMQSGKPKTKEELAATDLTPDDIKNLMEGLEADPKLLAEVAGGFMAMRHKAKFDAETEKIQIAKHKDTLSKQQNNFKGGLAGSGLIDKDHKNYDPVFAKWYETHMKEVLKDAK